MSEGVVVSHVGGMGRISGGKEKERKKEKNGLENNNIII